MKSVIRPYSPSDSLRSDRSATDRLRHRQKIRQAIRNNIADIIAEEAIIGQSQERVIKVPIRGVKEYRFVYGENSPGIGTGDGSTQPGQVVGKAGSGSGAGKGAGGDQPGTDYYETDITLEELIDIMFEDLELPDLERKNLRELLSDRTTKRKGYRRVGIRVHLDKKRTAKSRIRRKLRLVPEGQVKADSEERFPFHRNDVRYKRLRHDIKPQSNAVVLCIMDTSGSMDTVKKYLARSFFFLLYQLIKARYQNAEVVFIAHHTAATEVGEDDFFHKGESGGTLISSGYNKALQIINERYHPSLWNIYAFHCSDGDNFAYDNQAAMDAAEALCKIANLFGYGEIRASNPVGFESTMLAYLQKIKADNFRAMRFERKEDIWPCLKQFLAKEQTT